MYIKDKHCDYCTSFEIFLCGNAQIELIENYPCESKKLLRTREGIITDQFPNAVNKVRENNCYIGREKEYMKEYNKKNFDHIKELASIRSQ